VTDLNALYEACKPIISCRVHQWWGDVKCRQAARRSVTVNNDPDTTIELCTRHANQAVKRCHPQPVQVVDL
jgi:hypothetical protein